ncbi:MAG: hypothetical protein KY469_15325 [Actinobacteria bacterium]|nr:hypothetical protein [Actinomycetota bacterium]
MRTNAPRMVTVVLAVALTLAGLSLTTFHVAAVDEAVMELVSGAGLELDPREAGWWALLLSPLLLTAGSLLKDV